MRSGFGLTGLALVTLTLGAAACSGGAKTIYVTNDDPNGDGTSSSGGSTSGGTGTSSGGTGTSSGDPGGPVTTGDPTDPSTPAPPLVAGLAITDIAIFQGTKIPIVTTGTAVEKASRNAPVVNGRDALMRVYVSPGSDYSATAVTAELQLVSGKQVVATLKDTETLTAASTDEDQSSTFNFDIPAADLPAGVTYQIFLSATGGEVPTGSVTSRFPNAGGVQDLESETSGALKVVIVPIEYGADGSDRVPDVSATQLAAYTTAFMAKYPTTSVSVTARAPWPYASAISASGSGFSQALTAVTNLRKSDGVADDVYYYGAFEGAASFNSYCGGGCVTGLSTVVDSADPSEAFLRASVGIGFTGDDSMVTATHEVGHAHGREHAPCGGAQNVDPSFPYSDGSIGTWGYDITLKKLIDPTVGTDMMGYCDNTWVSDYTYTALFDRIAVVNGGTASAKSGGTASAMAPTSAASLAPSTTIQAGATQTFKMATVDETGTVSWGGDIELKAEPSAGELRPVQFLGANGAVVGTHNAHFFKYDHLPGGVLVMPASPTAQTGVSATVAKAWTQVKISGVSQILAR